MVYFYTHSAYWNMNKSSYLRSSIHASSAVPIRVVSLVPSITELLFDLGVGPSIVGRTKFCIHPEKEVKTIQRIGGTKNVNIDLIAQLKPDLIIANKEENMKEQIEALAVQFPVLISDIQSPEDAFQLIEELGAIFKKEQTAQELNKNIKSGFEKLNVLRKRKAIYLIWKNPYMTIGGDTFISKMMDMAGFENSYKTANRYPELTLQQMNESDVEFILLSSEPYPFTEKHVVELEQLFPGKKVILVDGEMFSWYGSRMLKASIYFEALQSMVFENESKA